MGLPITSSRPFAPGTTGWTAADLDDPEVGRRWQQGRYEIVEGVLTSMAPAMFRGGEALANLIFQIKTHLTAKKIPARFAVETDVILSDDRVARPDAVLMTADAIHRQEQAAAEAGKMDWRDARLYVAPTLIIESISPGHEQHDLKIKRRWYAEAKVENYWLLNAYEQSLECLVLDGTLYRIDQSGRARDELRPSLFPALVLPLAVLWD